MDHGQLSVKTDHGPAMHWLGIRCIYLGSDRQRGRRSLLEVLLYAADKMEVDASAMPRRLNGGNPPYACLFQGNSFSAPIFRAHSNILDSHSANDAFQNRRTHPNHMIHRYLKLAAAGPKVASEVLCRLCDPVSHERISCSSIGSLGTGG